MKYDLKNCSLLVTPARLGFGNISTPQFILVKFGDGEMTVNDRTNINYELDRDKLDDVRLGDESPLEISLTARYDYIRYPYAGSFSIIEAMEGVSSDGSPISWASWQNTDEGVAAEAREPWLDCSPYCCCLELHNDLRIQCPDSNLPSEITWYPYFRKENAPCSVKNGTIQFSGKCNVIDPIAKSIALGDWPNTYLPGGPGIKPYALWT